MSIESDIREVASQLHIDAIGFAPLSLVDSEEWGNFSEWLEQKHHAEMTYLENYIEQRQDPRLLLEEAQSVIVIAVNYYPPKRQDPDSPQISKYALGRDYHKVMKKLLTTLAEQIDREVAPHTYRTFVDTAPILERYWAEQSGIGFRGRNSNLIVPQVGSYVFLGEILTSLKLERDQRCKATCGACRKCIDLCPTGALTGHGLDARKCINYLTIEHSGSIPDELAVRFGTRLYGCDTCQDVCPYNQHTSPSYNFAAFPHLLHLSRSDIEDFGEEKYAQLFHGTAITRAKLSSMLRNIKIYLRNNPEIDYETKMDNHSSDKPCTRLL